MDWIQGMQSAIDYIETNLYSQIDYEQVGKAAGSSSFHFMRMFNMLTGFTVGEYVRNRRLTLAGQELAMSNARIVDIAFKYGYETHESFTKAFQRFHGISPSAAREPGASLKSIGRLLISVTLKGDKPMNYSMFEKEAFSIVGKKIKVSNIDGVNFKLIPQFWQDSMEDGTYEAFAKLSTDEMGAMGVCANFRENSFDYFIAVNYSGGEIPEGMEVLQVPRLTWVSFESVGPIPEALQDVTKRIFSEWFPSSEYEHANGPELEIYTPGDMQKLDYKSYVWVPVVKKAK